MCLGVPSLVGPVNPQELTVVFLGCLHDALPGGPTRAEGGHEGPVLATQHYDVGVRLVEVVVELGNRRSSALTPSCSRRAGSATKGAAGSIARYRTDLSSRRGLGALFSHRGGHVRAGLPVAPHGTSSAVLTHISRLKPTNRADVPVG